MENSEMNYRSTRGSNEYKRSAEAIIKGIAEDKGLYVPERIPALQIDPAQMTGWDYRQVAAAVLPKFLDDYSQEELTHCIDRAYDDKFEAPEVVPVVKAGDAYFLELYHGKTAAFKDMALSILPYLLTTAMVKEKEANKIAILTATSGDTGKAALEGFADVEGTEIVVFYPRDGVSLVQERQMTTQEGNNTHVYGIKGNFDDAQTAVKQIFNDSEVAKVLTESGYRLSSANSINIGRLVPQVAYYVWGYVQLLKDGVIQAGQQINVAVPTGNFGNILAAYYAKKMGIPIKTFICASNQNNVLSDFINTGIYDRNREFFVTSSPSMDILISSNLERLLYHLSGGNGDEIATMMSELDRNGSYEVSDLIRKGLEDFYGGFADEMETGQAIRSMYEDNAYLMDTHTAVGYKVYQDYKCATGDETPTLIASTASAYKFADSVAKALDPAETATGFAAVDAVASKTGVPVPSGLKGLSQRPVLHDLVLERDELSGTVVRLFR
jgi:threonine synthase